MHENARDQLGVPAAKVNGSSTHNGRPSAPEAHSAPSASSEVLNHALSEASGWLAARRARALHGAAPSRGSMQAWLARGTFGLFAALVLGSFVFIAIGLMSVTEASALLMPVAVLAAMTIGLFLGHRQ